MELSSITRNDNDEEGKLYCPIASFIILGVATHHQ